MADQSLAQRLGGNTQQPTGRLAQSLQAPANPAFDEEAFQQGIRATDWYRSFVQRYGEEPDLNAKDYDYRKAWAAGVRPAPDPYDGGFPHWPSSLESGEMLKSAEHPTAWKEHFMRQHGVNPDSLPDETVQQMRGQ